MFVVGVIEPHLDALYDVAYADAMLELVGFCGEPAQPYDVGGDDVGVHVGVDVGDDVADNVGVDVDVDVADNVGVDIGNDDVGDDDVSNDVGDDDVGGDR